MEIRKITVHKGATAFQHQPIRREITVIHAEDLRAGNAVVAVVNGVVVVAAAGIERRIFHVFYRLDFFHRGLVTNRDAVRQAVIQHFVLIIALIQLNLHRVCAGADEVLFDLLIRALDGGHDGDDRGDTDDDAEHRQERAHFVRSLIFSIMRQAPLASMPSFSSVFSSMPFALAPSIAEVP